MLGRGVLATPPFVGLLPSPGVPTLRPFMFLENEKLAEIPLSKAAESATSSPDRLSPSWVTYLLPDLEAAVLMQELTLRS